MSIDFDAFMDWAIDKWGDPNVKRSGPEVCVNSPFTNFDNGHHLWCNPDKNAFHCWKSGEHGSLHKLVAEFEPCDLADADEILGGGNLIRSLEAKLKAMFQEKTKERVNVEKKEIGFPTDACPFSSLPADQRAKVAEYMAGRNLPTDGLYYCAGGRYANRILIPYYGPKGNLIYFNCRDISGKSKVKYLGPPKEVGVGKGDVLWMKNWPKEGKIYLCEGEFDAMSLCVCGYQGSAAGGKNLTDKQVRMLQPYDVVFCFDNDKYGQEALHKFSAYKKSFHGGKATTVGCVNPAQGFKDWNEMLVKLGPGALNYYIAQSERQLDWGDFMEMRLRL